MRRVAITGVGAISALGRNAAEFGESLRQGRCGIGPIETADVSQLRFQNGAEVKGYSHHPYFDDRRADFLDRFAQFAVIAAREAVVSSGVEWTPELRESAGSSQARASAARAPRTSASKKFTSWGIPVCTR